MRGPEIKYPDLPGWTFDVDEISVGVYRVRGSNVVGMIIEQTGNDPEILLANCKFRNPDIANVKGRLFACDKRDKLLFNSMKD